MCSAPSRDRVALLLRAARLYWEEGLDQQEVADQLGYSRPTVSRMLSQARQAGIVTVSVSHPIERLMSLEQHLVSTFGLKHARVSEVKDVSGYGMGPEVARAAGSLLLEHCDSRSVIAVSNGRAVGAVVHHLPERAWPLAMVVAMLGSAGEALHLEDGPDICRNLALKLGARYRSLPVPLVFDSLNLARAVRDEDQVATTLELAGRCDVALTGIGAVGESTSPLLRRWMTPGIVRECQEKDVVAHLCGHHLDSTGHHIRTRLCGRTVCLDPERLRGIPLVIGVAAGREKVTAIRAALLGGYLSALVTNETTARALLSQS